MKYLCMCMTLQTVLTLRLIMNARKTLNVFQILKKGPHTHFELFM